jgi:hypothetical protein
MMGIGTPEICRGWRNILRINFVSSWFFFTRLYRDAGSKIYLKNPPIYIVSCKEGTDHPPIACSLLLQWHTLRHITGRGKILSLGSVHRQSQRKIPCTWPNWQHETTVHPTQETVSNRHLVNGRAANLKTLRISQDNVPNATNIINDLFTIHSFISSRLFPDGRDSSVGIATRYVLDGPEIEFR